MDEVIDFGICFRVSSVDDAGDVLVVLGLHVGDLGFVGVSDVGFHICDVPSKLVVLLSQTAVFVSQVGNLMGRFLEPLDFGVEDGNLVFILGDRSPEAIDLSQSSFQVVVLSEEVAILISKDHQLSFKVGKAVQPSLQLVVLPSQSVDALARIFRVPLDQLVLIVQGLHSDRVLAHLPVLAVELVLEFVNPALELADQGFLVVVVGVDLVVVSPDGDELLFGFSTSLQSFLEVENLSFEIFIFSLVTG